MLVLRRRVNIIKFFFSCIQTSKLLSSFSPNQPCTLVHQKITEAHNFTPTNEPLAISSAGCQGQLGSLLVPVIGLSILEGAYWLAAEVTEANKDIVILILRRFVVQRCCVGAFSFSQRVLPSPHSPKRLMTKSAIAMWYLFSKKACRELQRTKDK